MNSLEKTINGIYQRHLLKKKEKEEKRKVKLKVQERAEKIYQAIYDFIRKDDFDIKQCGPDYKYGEYKFNLGKTKVVIEVGNRGDFRRDYRAAVKVNSMWLNAPKDLKRRLAAELNELVKKEEEEEKERIIKEAVKEVEKKS